MKKKKTVRRPYGVRETAAAYGQSSTAKAATTSLQAEDQKKLMAKVPLWAATDGLVYPPRLSLEQCSGEQTARYKAAIACRLFNGRKWRLVDLTGGYGVDFSFMGQHADHPVYVERQEELCRIARHNFPLLGLQEAEVVNADGVAYLKNMAVADLIFLDPARRDAAGRKTVLIEDCEPNVVGLLPELLTKAPYAMVKLSPMLDIHRALASLNEAVPHAVAQVHVVADGRECKELLLVVGREKTVRPALFVVEGDQYFELDFDAEQTAEVSYTSSLETYLYEPGPALMKAGIFKWVAAHFNLQKLHPNSHLYTSHELLDHFPGRTFRVKGLFSFSKADLKALKTETQQANLSVRNFPGTVAEIRKRLKLKEGGTDHIFATTLADERHRLVLTERIL